MSSDDFSRIDYDGRCLPAAGWSLVLVGIAIPAIILTIVAVVGFVAYSGFGP